MFKKHKYTVSRSPNLSRDNICFALRDFVPFAQFKKRVLHVFYIIQMVPNHAKHHICS